MLGWGGGDVNVPCTCAHVGCYARCWVGVGGMLTFLALAHTSSTVCFSLHELLQRTAAKALLERKWSTKCGAILMISCPSPSIISPKQPDWSMIRSGSICTVGNGDKMRARTCGPTCTKCLLSEKKNAADSLLKFQRALNADATLFMSVVVVVVDVVVVVCLFLSIICLFPE